MNKLMRMCLGLLGYSLIGLLIIWGVGSLRGDTGIVFVWLIVIWFIATLFLASWFGLLLRKNPSLGNIVKFCLLSIFLGVLFEASFFILLVSDAKGVQAIPSEYQQLRANPMPLRGLILISVFLVLPVLITIASAIDGPDAPPESRPPDLNQ